MTAQSLVDDLIDAVRERAAFKEMAATASSRQTLWMSNRLSELEDIQEDRRARAIEVIQGLGDACKVASHTIVQLEGQPVEYKTALDLVFARKECEAALAKMEGQR